MAPPSSFFSMRGFDVTDARNGVSLFYLYNRWEGGAETEWASEARRCDRVDPSQKYAEERECHPLLANVRKLVNKTDITFLATN